MITPDLHYLAAPGTDIAVRVMPRASRNAVVVDEDGAIRIYTTCVPEDGKATAEAARLLARAVGVAKSRLVLIRGATARDKLFRVAG